MLVVVVVIGEEGMGVGTVAVSTPTLTHYVVKMAARRPAHLEAGHDGVGERGCLVGGEGMWEH